MEEQNCNNCAHYRAHYTKKRTRFIPVNRGHCIKNLQKKCLILCSAWAKNTVKPEQRQEAIKTVLRDMRRRITEMAQVLKDDSETENIINNAGGENSDK